jgi:hypothetical protein
VEVILAAVAVTVLLLAWVAWTSTRVDRLSDRTSLARQSLDVQLVRRAAALQALASHSAAALGPDREARLLALAAASLDAEDDSTREATENDLSRALRDIPGTVEPDLLADLSEAARRVALARRFYNDAVRDTRALRRHRFPRVLRLHAGRPLPRYFDIDDRLVEVTSRAGSAGQTRR